MFSRQNIAAALFSLALGSTTLLAADKAAVEVISGKVAKGEAILIDVREVDEIRDGMAAPAIWLSSTEIKGKGSRYAEIMKGLSKDKQIYVYCASGGRSGRFVEQLKEQGYKAENLGGFADWRDAGKAVKPVPDAGDKACPFLCKPKG